MRERERERERKRERESEDETKRATSLKIYQATPQTGYSSVKYYCIYGYHIIVRIYAKRTSIWRLSHISMTSRLEMVRLQRQPSSTLLLRKN